MVAETPTRPTVGCHPKCDKRGWPNPRWHHADCAVAHPDGPYTVADALNNAIAAVYANVGPSAPLVDLRRAMRLLGIAEDERAKTWVNNGSGFTPEPQGQEISRG